MRVFLLSIYDVTQSGGLSTYVHNLANEYSNSGDTPTIITPAHSKKPINKIVQTFGKIAYLINKRFGLEAYYRISAWCVWKELSRLLDAKTPTLLHFQDAVCAKYVVDRLPKLSMEKGVTTLLTLHGDLTNMNLSDSIVSSGTPAHAYSFELEKSWYFAVSKIIAVDTRLKKHALAFGVEESKIVAFPNFTDVTKFRPMTEDERDKARTELGYPNGKRVIFCPRRLVEKNGVSYAVEVVERLSDEYVLFITGEWQERSKILAKIESAGLSGKVVLTGDIPNSKIRNYYCASDMVIIPSISSAWVVEATSISAIESMACGVPVIASNIGWLPELVTDGENSFLAEEKNPDDFARKIKKYFLMSDSEKRSLKDCAVSSVEKKFSGGAYIRKVKDFLN